MSGEGKPGTADHVSGETATFVAEVIGNMLVELGAPRTLVQISVDPENEGYASVNPHAQKHLLTVLLCPEWEERDWRANGRTMLHEALHYMHAGQDRIIRDDLQDRLYNNDWWNVLRDNLHREYELYIDQLTTTLWEHMNWQRRISRLHKKFAYPKVVRY